MATINFTDYSTVIPAAWLNDVDDLVWGVFNGATSVANVWSAIGTGVAIASGTITATITGSTINSSVIGGVTPAAGTFTNLTATGTSTLTTVDINGGAIDGTVVGATTPAAGTFTTLTSTGLATLASVDINGGNIDGTAIGASTPALARFSGLSIGTAAQAGQALLADGNTMSIGTVNQDSYLWVFDGTTGNYPLRATRDTDGQIALFDAFDVGTPVTDANITVQGGGGATTFAAFLGGTTGFGYVGTPSAGSYDFLILAGGNNRMLFDASTGYVSAGVYVTPDTEFEVQGHRAAGGGIPVLLTVRNDYASGGQYGSSGIRFSNSNGFGYSYREFVNHEQTGYFQLTRDGTQEMRVTSGNFAFGAHSPDRRLHPEVDDASNSSVTYAARFTHTTSGTPAAGIGVGMEFEVETSASNNEVGAIIEAIATDVTATAERCDLVFKTQANGNPAAERARLNSTGLSIGSETPSSTLHVKCSGTGATGGVLLRASGSATTIGRWYEGSASNSTLELVSGGSVTMQLNSTGTSYATGGLLVGTSTSVAGKLQVSREDGDRNVIVARQHSDTTELAGVFGYKSRGTAAAPTAVSSGDHMAGFGAYGYDGTGWVRTAFITMTASQSYSVGNTGSHMYFYTTPTGSSSPTQRMALTQDGRLGIGTASISVSGRLHVVEEAGNSMYFQQYVGSSTGVNLRGGKARGTASAPTAVLSGDQLFLLTGEGYDGSAWTGARAQIGMYATENWSGAAQGAKMAIVTTPNGSTTAATRMTVDQNGYVRIGSGAPVSILDVKSTGTGTTSGIRLEQNTTSNPAAVIYEDTATNGAIELRSGATATVKFVANSDCYFNTGTKLIVGATSGTAGGGVLEVSNGITFPATASPVANANTLDDYQEGTFTPTILGDGTAGTTTYTTQSGVYTKIGRVVHFKLSLVWTNMTGTGNLIIGGLPETSANDGIVSPVSIAMSSVTYTAGNSISAQVQANSTNIYPTQMANGVAIALIPVDTAGTINIAGTYNV